MGNSIPEPEQTIVVVTRNPDPPDRLPTMTETPPTSNSATQVFLLVLSLIIRFRTVQRTVSSTTAAPAMGPVHFVTPADTTIHGGALQVPDTLGVETSGTVLNPEGKGKERARETSLYKLAAALQLAIRKLQRERRGKKLASWIPFVHYGV